MSGNGVDIGAVYQLLTQVAEAVAGHGQKLDSLDRRMDGFDRRMDGLDRRMDKLEGRMDQLEGRMDNLEHGLAGLRRAVTEYHASVLGHGILISELDERVRRIELHLNLPRVA